jgi:hypothetical protein
VPIFGATKLTLKHESVSKHQLHNLPPPKLHLSGLHPTSITVQTSQEQLLHTFYTKHHPHSFWR